MMHSRQLLFSTVCSASLLALGGCGQPETPAPEAPADAAPEASGTTSVYFGDTHLHTALSFDAGTFGNRLGPDEAYRFTKGEEVTASKGMQAKLRRPLDFVVVADHSDGMGFFQLIESGDPSIMDNEQMASWHHMIKEGGQSAVNAALELIMAFSQDKFPIPTNDPEAMWPVWNDMVAAAEKYNDPGNFTAFIGYEWTSLVKGNNLHRVVIFRDDADKAGTRLPYTLADSPDPEDLWNNLAEYEAETGGQVLAIPHNGNLSNGLMFDVETLSGGEITLDYAQRRQEWEPLYETTQIKGDGETHPHPLVSPEDEFADYENWDVGNLDLSEIKKPEMLPGEYARSGLKRGLEFEEKLGVNPYKFGQIGSTDSHTSLPTADEDNFFGKHSGNEPSPERTSLPLLETDNGVIMEYQMAASGYAAVWAQENTRESLWDAMKRRETYATTGSRMTVRFFGGYAFDGTESVADLYAADGYAKGVPMGSDLPAGEGAPTFLVAAEMDPTNGNLDRVQIVKGWIGADGKAKERIYDLAVSDGRTIEDDGRFRTPLGNTVKIHEATWENSIGAPSLNAIWTDPEFDASQRAFYYVRVIEIPTPRWTAYDALRFGLDLPDEVEMFTQERAYTSPIWYTPAG
ncbi:MAG: DUF3604 domain-containing protein [Gammaproteobacteria bacterium]